MSRASIDAKLRDAAQPALERVRAVLLEYIDAFIARAPAEYRPGLQSLRDSIAMATVLPADLMGVVLAAIQDAFLKGDFGPATGDDADTA